MAIWDRSGTDGSFSLGAELRLLKWETPPKTPNPPALHWWLTANQPQEGQHHDFYFD